MQVDFWGLSMTRRKRLFLIIALVLLIICIILYVISGFFVVKKQDAVTIPSGGLSQSIFELQNMDYKSMNGLTRRYSFANMPFTIDAPSGEVAKVEGADFLYNAPYYFYYNVLTPQEELLPGLLSQIVKVVAPGYAGEEAFIDVLHEESGNINGCSATYMIGRVSIPDMAEKYFCLYRLHIDENIYKSSYDMLIGCIAEGYTNENLSNLQMLACSTVGTLQYNAERAKELGE